jgi:hypothetical protein
MTVIQTVIGPVGENKYIVKEIREATEVYDLWYPRPELGQTPENNPDVKRRMELLRKHGYSNLELKKWFRTDGLIHPDLDRVITNNPRGKNCKK